MRRIVMSCVVFVSVMSGVQAQTARTPLEGVWVFTAVNGGAPPPERGEMALRFAGAVYEQLMDGAAVERGAVKVTDAKPHLAVDLTIGGGPSAGQLQLGWCQLAGTTLTCKLAAPGVKVRPTTLTPEKGAFQFVAVRR